MTTLQSTLFQRCARILTVKHQPKNFFHPLKDHSQLPLVIDILSRQQQHHLALASVASEKIHFAFAECIAEHVASNPLPKSLRDASVIYLDIMQLLMANIRQEQLEISFRQWSNEARDANKKILLFLNQDSPFLYDHSNPLNGFCGELLRNILLDDCWRVITFTRHTKELDYLKNYFTVVNLASPTRSELIAVLKSHRHAIETFHQVHLSEETFSSAFSLAEHYLAGTSVFDKALELLDSAASRASIDTNMQKSIVTSQLLTQIVSSWTHIPLTHLHNSKFQASKFQDAMRKQIFGQDPAINQITSLVQNACTKLQRTRGPLCSFLFAGPQCTGKTETAYAIAEHLFGQRDALVQVNLGKTHYASLSDIKVNPAKGQHHSLNLLQAIQETPFAVILIENMDQASREVLELFHDVFHLGFVIDSAGVKYDFHHAIFIITTRISSTHFNKLSANIASGQTQKAVDLVQLVMNNSLHDAATNPFSPQELSDALYPDLAARFSANLLQHLNIVPFVHLDYAALEKIVRTRIKALSRRMEINFGIEITVAHEVISFLAHEALQRKSQHKTIESTLEFYLYSCISHELLLRAEDKEIPKKLRVRLNDSGQLLSL